MLSCSRTLIPGGAVDRKVITAERDDMLSSATLTSVHSSLSAPGSYHRCRVAPSWRPVLRPAVGCGRLFPDRSAWAGWRWGWPGSWPAVGWAPRWPPARTHGSLQSNGTTLVRSVCLVTMETPDWDVPQIVSPCWQRKSASDNEDILSQKRSAVISIHAVGLSDSYYALTHYLGWPPWIKIQTVSL